jgi:hypothetical protein
MVGCGDEAMLGMLMVHYTMRQRLVSIGEDFDIVDEHGNPVYRVDGKALRLRETFVIEDLQGREVATIREKKLTLRESMDVLRAGDLRSNEYGLMFPRYPAHPHRNPLSEAPEKLP